MKKHIPVGVPVDIPPEFSEKSADEFVQYMLGKWHETESASGKKRLDSVVALMRQRGGLTDEHLKKYEDGKKSR